MKIAILIGAALLGTGVAAAPADAQRYGWHDGYRDGGYRDGGYRYGYDRRDRHWNGDRDRRDWRGARGWRGARDWNRGRTVCRWERGYYGRQRVCYRVGR